MSIKELLDLHGYKFSSTCTCNGFKTYKYKKENYQFQWRINAYRFRMLYQGRTIKSWTAVKEAESYLNSLHAEVPA